MIAWIVIMITIPIIGWVGDDYFEIGVTGGVLLQACTVLTILQQAWGTSATIRLILFILPVTWLIEYVGSHHGLPFGDYYYTNLLTPQIGGVPVIIPIAWLMMLPVCWGVAAGVLEREKGRKGDKAHYALRFSLLSGLAMTAWDLFLDPQMVGWGYWIWEDPGLYFGIPLLNFVGWWLCSSLITGLVLILFKPQTLPIKPLVIIYAIVWALQSVGQALFWGQPGPAAVGFVAMGLLLWLVFSKKITWI